MFRNFCVKKPLNLNFLMPEILIIEDEKELREGMAELLSFEGYEVVQTTNGIEGIQAASVKVPDLVLCDIKMPEMDGFEVLHQLKMHDAFTLVPFIFISVLKERDHIRKGMISGADDYLAKPFTRDELLSAITTRLDKFSRQELVIKRSLSEIESRFDHDILRLSIANDDQFSPIEWVSGNQSLKKLLYEKGLPMMRETVHLIETNNIIQGIKTLIKKELQNDNSNTEPQKKLLLELKNKIDRKAMLSDNLTVFQLKFNQLYPHFTAGFTQSFQHLTQYELMPTSAMLIGLNTHQIADLLNISAESIKKSRYRLKKKLGLKKQDDLLQFIQSFNSIEFKKKAPDKRQRTVPV
jgi:CheY-like chemotaxis protein